MNNVLNRAFCVVVLSVAPLASASADSLADIYQLALGNDPQLRAARATYRAGREALPIARAGLLPQISASAEYTDGQGDTSSARVLSETFRPSNTGENDDESETYMVSLSQPLFDLPAWFTFKQGQELDREASAQFAAEQQGLILRVADAYFGALRASEDLRSARAEQRAIGRQLEQTKERFEVGLLPITDVHEAQAVYDEAAVNALEAASALDIAFESLEVLTGQPHRELAGLTAGFPVVEPEPRDPEAWVQFASGNNFALQAAHHRMASAEQNAKASKAEHLPRVSANLSYTNSHTDGVFTRDSTGNNEPFFADNEPTVLSVRVDAPLFSGGLISAQRRQAHQQFIAAEERYQYSARRTTQQARSLHLKVVTNAARVNARNQAVTSARSALDATQAGYEVGTRNIVDVLLAQRTLHQAERNYANARYDYIASMLQLKEVAGQLSPEDIGQLNAWLDPSLVVGKASAVPATQQQ